MEGVYVLTEEKINKLIEQRKTESEKVKRLIRINQYPSAEEMPIVIEQMKQIGIPVELMKRLYHREILNNMYQ